MNTDDEYFLRAQILDVLHPGRANVAKVRQRRDGLGFFDPKTRRAATRLTRTRRLTIDWYLTMQAELQEKLAKMYNVSDEKCVSIFGFRTAFGGGKSTGFGLIYNDLEAMKKFEPKHRLIRAGLQTAVQKSRKNIKEKKNRVKKLRGGAKNKVM